MNAWVLKAGWALAREVWKESRQPATAPAIRVRRDAPDFSILSDVCGLLVGIVLCLFGAWYGLQAIDWLFCAVFPHAVGL